MNIIRRIKDIFTNPVEPQPYSEWDIHWYGHILKHSQGFSGEMIYITADHLGIVQDWDDDRIVPRLGDKLTYIDSKEKRGGSRMPLPAHLTGVVIEVKHGAYGHGGTIIVFAMDNIINGSDLNIYEVVTDEVFAEVQEARQRILAGGVIPYSSIISIS